MASGDALALPSRVARMAEAVEVAVLMAVALEVPLGGAVAVVVASGLVPPPGLWLVAVVVVLSDRLLAG